MSKRRRKSASRSAAAAAGTRADVSRPSRAGERAGGAVDRPGAPVSSSPAHAPSISGSSTGSRTHQFLPSRDWRFLVLAVVASTLFAVDRISKAAVQATIARTGGEVVVIPKVISFRFVANRGAAFGMGEGLVSTFVLFAVVVTIAIAIYLWRTKSVSKLETVGLAMTVGGAIGNALDRVLLGYVTDFIAVRFVDFPVFNIADIAVTVGVALAFIGFIFLSPAAKVDATAELNRRDEARRARDAKHRAGRAHRAGDEHRGGGR